MGLAELLGVVHILLVIAPASDIRDFFPILVSLKRFKSYNLMICLLAKIFALLSTMYKL